MKFYFIVPGKQTLPSEELLNRVRELGEVVVIEHKGKLAELGQLKNDPEEKVLCLDPDPFDSNLDAESVKDIPNVKAIMPSTTGFDWIHPDVLKGLGVVACNVPGFSADAVAEYAVAMAIEISRKLPMVIKTGWKMQWNDPKQMLLKDRTAGVIGLGRIGTRMAEILQGIGMHVMYWSKDARDERFQYAELPELFKTADVIMPALAVNPGTQKLLTNELLDSVKQSAVLVGIGRVKTLWDEEYILEKVKKGEIFGYAFEGEDAKDFNSYEGNVWALPPMAWYTQDSLDNLMRGWVENIIAFAKGKPQNVINR